MTHKFTHLSVTQLEELVRLAKEEQHEQFLQGLEQELQERREEEKKVKRIHKPFDMTYTITFSGITQGDGVSTLTSQMIRDKLIYILEKLLAEGKIRDFTVTVGRNNLEEAEKTITKSKQPTEKHD